MSLFTPLSGLLGGGLIGFSAATLLLGTGHILGASGLFTAVVLHPRKTLLNPENQWKASLVASFLIAAKIWSTTFDTVDGRIGTNSSTPVLGFAGNALAGFLVGLGTKLSNGCTSGHGVCGMARLSKRSFVAVAVFMATGILTAVSLSPNNGTAGKFLHVGKEVVPSLLPTTLTKTIATVLVSIVAGAAIPPLIRPISTEHQTGSKEFDRDVNMKRQILPAILAGGLFAVGLAISGMIMPSKVYGFLDVSGLRTGTYDPTLICVMGSAVVVSWVSYQFVKGWQVVKFFGNEGLTCPLALKKSSGKFSIPDNKVIDSELVVGAAIFGLGWGIGGLCPGPALFNGAAGYPTVLFFWWPCFFAGSLVAEKFREAKARSRS